MVKKIIITGGCGFIGHGIVEHIMRKTNWEIIILDKLSYASNGFERIRDIGILDNARLRIFTIDLINPFSEGLIKEIGDVNFIVHCAAETHVDNSIRDPVPFVMNNVASTLNILEYARKCKKLEKFFYFSTDEVYGSAPEGVFYKETDRHTPTNPYSASKSCGEQLAKSYENTYKLPIIMVNVMNAFGERQNIEKFIPKCIKNVLEDKKIDIHSDKNCEKSGTRFYIHIRNIASAILFLINKGEIGELYHITGEKEMSNLELAQFVADVLNKELKYELVNFHEDRPGHDLRYALDGSKLFSLGFKLPLDFKESLRKTILWTVENHKWIE
jgi:dTDP-glucose 4,6-dehydratase